MVSLEGDFLDEQIIETRNPPPGYPELSEYGVVCYDYNCGQPIGWGFKIRSHLGEERFSALGKYGKLECLELGNYVLVIKWMTPEEAIEKYGPITHQLFGPQGGWKSVTYGTTKFMNKQLKPTPELEKRFNYLREVLPRGGVEKPKYSTQELEISQDMKKIRKKHGLSQEKLAELLRVKKTTIRDWENMKN